MKKNDLVVSSHLGEATPADIAEGEILEANRMPTQKNLDAEDLNTALQNYVPGTKEERLLVRRIDIFMIPMLWLMCVLAYVDRNNIGNANAAGLGDDLGLSDNGYSLVISIFFVGYVLWEVPSNIILSRCRPSWYLPGIMTVWGTIVCAMSQAKSYHGLLIYRLFLGVIEAGFFPGVLYIMTCWYKKNEIGKRFCIFFTALCFSGAASGLISGAVISGLEGAKGMRGWRWLFLIEGLLTIGLAFVAKFVLPDYPDKASYHLTAEQRILAGVRIMHDKMQTAVYSRKLTSLESIKAAAFDLRTCVFIILYMTQNGSTTISYFIPTVLQNMGYHGVRAQWMTVPIWATGTVFLLVFSQTADRLSDRRWHITFGLSVAFTSAIVTLAVPHNLTARYAMMCFYIAGLYMTLPLILNWASEIMSLPAEKRAVVIAMVNCVGSLSSIYGSYLWPASDAPDYTTGFVTVSCFMGFGVVLASTLPLLFRFLPKFTTRAERELEAEIS